MWRMMTVVGMVGAMLTAAGQGAEAQAGPAGCWVGTVGSGQQLARAVMRLDPSGGWSGTMSVMGRTMRVDTLRNLVVRGDSATFAYGAGERETAVAAAMGTDGRLSGTLTRGETTQPLALARNDGNPDPARALLGYWNGALLSGGSQVLRAGLRFATAPCGQVYLTFDSPDQGASDLPITALSLAGDSLRFEMQYVDGAFRGTVSADKAKIVGLWTQAGNTLDLELTKDPAK
ncbi:MAG: hypothetical protein OEW06_13445 [Gemmatimonadota bacterium]|nr:hypothetical protein [Gemmatimonadota bacterium]